MICGPRSKESPSQSYHSGKRREMKAKHIRKEGLTGLRHPKKNKEKNQALSDQDPASKKNAGTGQRTALLPVSSFRPGRT